jgi:uncharacterized membrane protein YhfC
MAFCLPIYYSIYGMLIAALTQEAGMWLWQHHIKVSVNRKVENLVLKRDSVSRGMVLYW